MEDILEELVGNIRDEYDAVEEMENKIEQIGDDTYVVDGLMEIDYINDALHLELPTDEYETISGLVIALLGEIPEEEDHPVIDYQNYTFTVISSNEKIIQTVQIKVNEPVSVLITEADENNSGEES